MSSLDEVDRFPTSKDFLDFMEGLADTSSEVTDDFFRDSSKSGEKLPASVQGLGTLLSLVYRTACCYWGCQGGDHQVEWLAGRVVNQSMSAYRLIRAAFYDEALMLIRGIGEIANLLWLFEKDGNALTEWKNASRADRMKLFGPYQVREKLRKLNPFVPIDDDRYRSLCEVGTHPVPAFPPGHYNGIGKPILGHVLQPTGIFVCITELSFALSMCATPLSKLLGLEENVRKSVGKEVVSLLRNLGAFTILNYDELLEQARTLATDSS